MFEHNLLVQPGADWINRSQRAFKLALLALPALLCFASVGSAAPSTNAFLVTVSLPIDEDSQKRVIASIQSITAMQSTNGTRPTLVLQFGDPDTEATGRQTDFSRALALSRFLTSDAANGLRKIAYLGRPIEGHAVLPILACDQIAVSETARIGDAGIIEAAFEPAIEAFYLSISQRRRIFPADAVRAMLNPELELVRINEVDRGERFLCGEELVAVRAEGNVVEEQVLASSGEYARFSGNQLREYRWATYEAADLQSLATDLGLARFEQVGSAGDVTVNPILVELIGPVNSRRMSRLLAGLNDAIQRDERNHVLLRIDSAGGGLNESVRVASTVANLPSDGVQTTCYVDGKARGDAAIIALSAQRVYMSPDAVLGGPGASNMSPAELRDLQESIVEVGEATGRSTALLRGLLDEQLEVFRYTDTRTGRVAYFGQDDLVDREDVARWEQGERVALSAGLTADDAVALGLVQGIEDGLVAVSSRLDFDSVPQLAKDRPIVRFVEQLGRQPWLPRMLLFMGFFMLMVETRAPGLGVPGFLSIVCLLLFFWTQVAGGTAEWLEIVLFIGGVACLMLEIFVVPGFGIFGIGGAIMVLSSVVLVSQTFVVPTNSYQFRTMTDSMVRVIASMGGVLGGIFALRWMFPQLPFFRHLMMEQDADESRQRDLAEAMVDWNHLVGQRGVTTTPLVPAGKARFGDDLVAVISRGTMVDAGASVLVKDVHGNRVLVDECEPERVRSQAEAERG